jgi:hypothetical protein
MKNKQATAGSLISHKKDFLQHSTHLISSFPFSYNVRVTTRRTMSEAKNDEDVVLHDWAKAKTKAILENLHILHTRILPQLAKLTRLQELNNSGCNELELYLPPRSVFCGT